MVETEELLQKILANQVRDQELQKKEQERRGIFDTLNIFVAIIAIWAFGFSIVAFSDTMTEGEKRFWVPVIMVGGLLYVLSALYLWRWQGRKKPGEKK